MSAVDFKLFLMRSDHGDTEPAMITVPAAGQNIKYTVSKQIISAGSRSGRRKLKYRRIMYQRIDADGNNVGSPTYREFFAGNKTEHKIDEEFEEYNSTSTVETLGGTGIKIYFDGVDPYEIQELFFVIGRY